MIAFLLDLTAYHVSTTRPSRLTQVVRRSFALSLLSLLGLTVVGCGVDVVQPQGNRHRKAATDPVYSPPDTALVTSAPPVQLEAIDDPHLASGTPKLVAPETHHDFGTMNPMTNQRRTFVVRNEGTAPLRFLDRRSSCECTVGHFPQEPVMPGESAEILVQWHAPANKRVFRQTATVETNDPQCPSLEFVIQGKVRVHLGAEPPELVASDLRPGESRTLTTIISSQVWERMKVDSIESSLEGLSWEIQPASSDQLQEYSAVAGYQLNVTLPDSLPIGSFRHWVRLHVDPQVEGQAPDVYELPLHGKVLRRLAVYGPGIDMTGTLDLGVVSAREGLQRRLILKVYDQDASLRVKELSADPEFLELEVNPAQTNQPMSSVYYLDVRIPPGVANDVRYLRTNPGFIKLTFDHPRIDPLDLKVVLTVARD